MTKLISLLVLFLAQVPAPASGPSISGRVITNEGKPVRDVAIQLYRMEYLRGLPKLIFVRGAGTGTRTNDVGEYLVKAPAPGRYYMSAVARDLQAIGRYYPGTVDSSDAEPIDVSGENVRVKDLVLSPVSVFTIRGHFIQPAGILPRSAASGVQRLDKRQSNDFPAIRFGIEGDPERFEVRVPAAGTYGLSFGLMTDSVDYLGRAVVEVHGNVDGVSVVAVRGGSLVVRAVLDSDPVTFSLIHIDPDDTMVRPAIARPNSDGVLIMKGVFATRYNVGIDGLAPDLYISHIRFNGVDSTVPAFTASENVLDGTLDIYLAKGTHIEGKAANEDRSSPKGAIAALIPADRNRHDLYQDCEVDENGAFHFEGVAPGKYRMFAWNEVPPGIPERRFHETIRGSRPRCRCTKRITPGDDLKDHPTLQNTLTFYKFHQREAKYQKQRPRKKK